MPRQLARVVDQFEAARARLRRLDRQTPRARWAIRREQGQWSVAECVAHLNLTSRAYIPLLRSAFAQRPLSANPVRHYHRDFVGWLVGLAVGPLPRIGRWRFGRLSTLPAFVPSGDLERQTVLAEFETLQNEQIALAKDADGRELGDIWIVSPFEKRVKYNAYSCLVLLPRHQRRHLDQAEQLWSGAPEEPEA